MNNKIKILMKKTGLGEILEEPKRIKGGLSHRMYKVVTNKGTYAVKELNSNIMKRKTAYSNFQISEKIADKAKKEGIPVVSAIKIENNIITKVDEQYYMIFEWLDGKILKAEEITKEHCKTIGKILGKIHSINFNNIRKEEMPDEKIKIFDWEKYIKISKQEKKTYYSLLEENKEPFEKLNEKTIIAVKESKKKQVISHRDLDIKNVMWKENKPFIIDWEASGYINPTVETISTAYYWSGGETEQLDQLKFETFLKSYKENSNIPIDTEVKTLIYADFYCKLNWLEYNLKRTIEDEYDQEEKELAENEVIKSIKDIKYNLSQINKIIKILEKE